MMMIRKVEEEITTKQLNDYVNRGLSRARAYARTEVHNKIDSSIKMGGYSTVSTK